MGVKKQVTRCK